MAYAHAQHSSIGELEQKVVASGAPLSHGDSDLGSRNSPYSSPASANNAAHRRSRGNLPARSTFPCEEMRRDLSVPAVRTQPGSGTRILRCIIILCSRQASDSVFHPCCG